MGLALSENARRRLLSHKCDLGNSARPDYFKWTFQQLLQKSSRTGKSLEFGRKTALPLRSRVFGHIESEFRKTLTGPDPWCKCPLSFLIVPENHLVVLERLPTTTKKCIAVSETSQFSRTSNSIPREPTRFLPCPGTLLPPRSRSSRTARSSPAVCGRELTHTLSPRYSPPTSAHFVEPVQ